MRLDTVFRHLLSQLASPIAEACNNVSKALAPMPKEVIDMAERCFFFEWQQTAGVSVDPERVPTERARVGNVLTSIFMAQLLLHLPLACSREKNTSCVAKEIRAIEAALGQWRPVRSLRVGSVTRLAPLRAKRQPSQRGTRCRAWR